MKLGKAFIQRLILAIVTSIIIALAVAYRFHIYYGLLRLFTPRTNNPDNNEIIKGLHPIFAYKIARFVKKLEKEGNTVILTSGYRSFLHQQSLYQSGQTPAPPGGSYHNYGFAVDMNVDGLKKASSKSKWQPFGNIGKNDFGLRWGGDFSNYDPIHFDDGNIFNISLLKKAYEEKLVNNKFVKVFK